MDDERSVRPGTTVVIESGLIAEVGPSDRISVEDDVTVVDGRGTVLLPGFINTHTHVPQILLRGGLSHDRVLTDWLFNVLYPGLACYDTTDIEVASLLYATEALTGGITTIVNNDHVLPQDWVGAASAAKRAFGQAGLRVIYARMFADHFDERLSGYTDAVRATHPELSYPSVRVPFEDLNDRFTELYEAVHDPDGLFTVWPSPTSVRATSLTALQLSQQLAARHGTGWTCHIAETVIERQALGMGTVDWLDRHNLLDGRLLAGHCVDVDDRDLRLLRRAGASVSTQPASNCFLGSGIAPVPRMLDQGVTVGVGTDDANCNNAVNLLADLRLLALLHRGATRDAAAITPEKAFEMVTIDAARAIGMADRIGSIEVGKRADLCLIDLTQRQFVPSFDVLATLLFQANGSEVRDVFVDGVHAVRNGRPTYLSVEAEQALLLDAQSRSQRIVQESGLQPQRPWTTLGR
jgi:atrazine chlorohydrolase/5-methylthioadenosine/S-adenosylhomocysteine deaminase/melamine deaminase